MLTGVQKKRACRAFFQLVGYGTTVSFASRGATVVGKVSIIRVDDVEIEPLVHLGWKYRKRYPFKAIVPTTLECVP